MMVGKKLYVYDPIGHDLYDGRTSCIAGTVVVKVQPPGCPVNGTMKHCYIADAETGGFYGLVLENSLVPCE